MNRYSGGWQALKDVAAKVAASGEQISDDELMQRARQLRDSRNAACIRAEVEAMDWPDFIE